MAQRSALVWELWRVLPRTRFALEFEPWHHPGRADEAQRWLANKPDAVYTHDGLVVDFRKNSGGGGTLSVDVWQILIRKHRPEMLQGSHDELILVSK